jgi:guanylate kinase
MSGQLYVISGPSGAGKSTIIQRVRERVNDLGYSISHTTRKPRAGEVDGVDYHFVSKDVFGRMIEEGAFVEWAEVYQDSYGTSLSSLRNQVDQGLDVLMDLDSQGAKNMRDHFEDCILIYVLPPSLQSLEKRLRGRATDTDETIKKRFEKAVGELKECVYYDYLVVNDNPNIAAEEIEAIILSEKCRKSRRLAKVESMLGLPLADKNKVDTD